MVDVQSTLMASEQKEDSQTPGGHPLYISHMDFVRTQALEFHKVIMRQKHPHPFQATSTAQHVVQNGKWHIF